MLSVPVLTTDIDRQNLAAAKLKGILTDLKMDTTQFATAISILYGESPTRARVNGSSSSAGYLPFQVPSNYLISKLPRPGLCKLSRPPPPQILYANNTDICVAVVIWGTISACTGAVQSYGALLGIRVLLGASEAVFFPG